MSFGKPSDIFLVPKILIKDERIKRYENKIIKKTSNVYHGVSDIDW